jgi:hypothetical protein
MFFKSFLPEFDIEKKNSNKINKHIQSAGFGDKIKAKLSSFIAVHMNRVLKSHQHFAVVNMLLGELFLL